MTQLSDAQRAQVLALLEQHHGVGARSRGSAGWLTQRVDAAIAELATGRGLDGQQVVGLLREDRAELAALADILRIGETCLYRDPAQWDALRTHLAAQQGPRIRGLSVGCSTGEEAWTLAMVIDAAAATQWRVVGLDRNAPALAVARVGRYPASCARHLPPELRRRYLTDEGDSLRIATALARRVAFTARDATTGLPPGSYEVIVCKNVLIYFGEQAGTKLVRDLMRALAPGGVLLVARSEVPRLRALGYTGLPAANGVTFFR